MHLYDPSRPKIGPHLAYTTPSSRPAGAIPPWTIYPRSDGYVYLSIFLMTQPNNARQYEWRFAPADFLLAYLEWLDDPEAWYRSRLGWAWEDIPSAPPKNKFSLSDIGL